MFKAILALTFCIVSLNTALLRVQASTSRSSIPIATSFIYPVGDGTVQPTWVPGNTNGYFITQGFNTSCDPAKGEGFYLYGLYYCGHTGVDLASQSASSVIHATAAGLIVSAGYNGGYGVMVRIQHILPDGSSVYSQYEHMAYGSLAVYDGEIVTQGQQLGLVGATGFATGAHLHFEIKSTNEDGWGYTFGNDSLIAGYLEPLTFVAAHQYHPVSIIVPSGRAQQVFPAESDLILRTFLKAYQHFVVVSTNDGLRVRSKPGLTAKVLGVALRGAKLGYLQTQGVWIKVALPQKVTGWVNRKYVAGYQNWSLANRPTLKTAVASTKIWPPSGPVAIVDPVVTVGLNVHAAPGQNHPVISSVFEGDKLSIISQTTNWERVLTQDGTKGWVLRRYLDEGGVHASNASTTILARAAVLNVRSGPGLQYGVTGSVFKGTEMTLVSATPHWGAVTLPGGTTGWVALPMTSEASMVTANATAPHTTAVPATSHATTSTSRASTPTAATQRQTYVHVTASVLNIRRGPGETHSVVAQVLRNTKLQLLDSTAHWAHVALPASNISGWVLLLYTR